MTLLIDLLVALCLVSGAFFAFVAALGVVRLPDVFIRMHASTKAGTLGAGLIMAAVAINAADADVTWRVLAIIAFLLITAPIGAHVIGRAAYRTGVPLWSASVVDEWKAQIPTPSDAGRSVGDPPAEPGGAGPAAR